MDDVDEELLGDLADVAAAPRLLVACGFEGALADPTPDPDDARADQQSSEALNVLLALSGTTVAVVSRRPADAVAELMFLSGSKGGLRVITPEDVPGLRAEVDAALVVVDADPETLAAAQVGDVAVAVGDGAAAALGPGVHQVADPGGVIVVLEELAERRRYP